ncbi:MAG: tRNA (adenosine(37)-N6)-dimethylallyltransferase MiaA [Spirochaetota bacterium]
MDIQARKIILLCGATGSGKTELTKQLDPKYFEVLCFDSRQVYRHLEVGTSKPSREFRLQLQHHLVDFLEPDQRINAADFVGLAQKSLDSVYSRGKVPLITCGTGFYLRAFLYGMLPVPKIPSDVHKKVNAMEKEERWKLLQEKDSETSQLLAFNDVYRVSRALEVILTTGEKWSKIQKQAPQNGILGKGIQVVGVFLDWSRDVLYQRINARAKDMISRGMLEEARSVMQAYGEDCPALKSLGYNFAVENIKGKIDSGNFYELFAKSHRNYAKKQITWFRKEPLAVPIAYNEALEYIKNNSGEC